MYYCKYECLECGMYTEEPGETFETKDEAREHGDYAGRFHGGCEAPSVQVTIGKRDW